MLSLEDLVYTYPDQYDPSIQTKITAKYEFKQLASYLAEPIPQPGKLYNHQELIKRYMLVYDRLLIFHRTGTGKSGVAFGTAEQFKSSMISATVDYVSNYILPKKTHIKRVVILTRGKTLIDELKQQLTERINPNEYLTNEVVDPNIDKTTRTRRLNALIRKFYDIQTYITFTSYITKTRMNDNQIENEYSNYLFIVDEAQNLNIGNGLGEGDRSKIEVYNTLHKLFHTAKRIKVMLLSATPIIDKVDEIKSLMNLILPLDRQMDVKLKLEDISLNDIEPYFRGIISYVREYGNNINVQFEGVRLDDQQIVVYKDEMSTFQSYYYNLTKSTNFRISERQAANFIFPDGSSGTQGFIKYIYRISPDVYEGNEEIIPYLDDIYKLQKLSSKFASVISLCKSSKGNCFVFSDFKDVGAILLSVCFKHQGFEQLVDGLGIYVDGHIIADYPKRLRFAMITTETTPERARSIKQVFNSYENRHGEYVKVMIGSPVIGMGINLSNVLNIHIVDPSWDRTVTYQAFSRALRGTASHINLLNESYPLTVHIYQHCLVPDTVDVDMYKLSEYKDIQNSKIIRYMKQCAIDAYIHYQRNVRDNDIDYTPECDYDICRYTPFSPYPTYTDYTSYDVLYMNDKFELILYGLRWLYSYVFYSTIDNIYTSINQHLRELQLIDEDIELKYYVKSIYKVISNRIPLTNRYGFISYMYEYNNIYYILNEYPIYKHQIADRYYSEHLIGVEYTNLETYLGKVSYDYERQQFDELRRLYINHEADEDEIEDVLHGFDIESRVKLVEDSISRIVEGRGDTFDDMIYRVYQYYIFRFHEPVDYISQYQVENKQGRKRTKLRLRKMTLEELENFEYIADVNNKVVYIHTLYSQKFDRVSYSTTTKINKAESRIRILYNNIWRDVTESELYVYNMLAQKDIYNRFKEYEKYEIYGIYYRTSDRKFRIRDRTEESSRAVIDNRRINRGKDCSTWVKSDLIMLMYRLGVPLDIVVEVNDSNIDNIKRKLIDIGFDKNVVESINQHQITYYISYSSTQYTREDLCNRIYDYLYSNGKVLII